MRRPATRSLREPRSALRGGMALAAAIAGLIMTILLPAKPAQAHSALLATDPATGASVTTRISEVTLTFNERVHGDFSTVMVNGKSSRGAIVSYSEGRVQVIDDVVHQKVYPLRSGTYDVAWRVISVDGHPVEGQFAFTVRLPADQEPAGDPPRPPTPTSGSSSNHRSAWIAGGVAALVIAAALVTWAFFPWPRTRLRSGADLDDTEPDRPAGRAKSWGRQ